MRGDINRIFYDIGKWMLAVAFAAAIFIWIFGDSWLVKVPDCMFETVTGLYCPGCGGTRAVIALLQGHPVRSFLLHPAVIYGAVVYTVFMIRMFLLKHYSIGTEKDGRVLIFIYIGIGIVLVQWIVKLVLLIRYGVHVL